MSKKTKMKSTKEPIINTDSLQAIFEFSQIKERRNLSCVSSVYKEAFYVSREECTKIALKRLVQERRDRYEFPVVKSKYQTVKECLPRNIEHDRLVVFLFYQAVNIIKNILALDDVDIWDLDEDYLETVIRCNKFMHSIFMKLGTLRFFSTMDSNRTIETIFQDCSRGGNEFV